MRKTILSIGIIAVLLVALLVLTGCGEKNEEAKTIVGSWQHTAGYTYTFNEDKTGTYSLGGRYIEFTYEDKGDRVSITYYGNTKASEYEYKIEGNKLIIKDSLGSDVEYTRK